MDENKSLEAIIAQLEQEKKKMSIIANMSADSIFEYDIKTGHMRYTATSIWGRDMTEVADFERVFLKEESVHPEDLLIVKDFLTQLREGKPDIFIEYREKADDGEYCYFELKAKTICDENNTPILVLGRLANINERKNKELAFEKLSKIDCLTELYNKSAIRSNVEASLTQRSENELSALYVIDIDYFKEINDSYGHLFGDAVLCSVSDEMKHIFNQNSFLGRIGGDEFLAYVEHTTKSEAAECAKRLCSHIRNIYEDMEEESKLKISCSIGISFSRGSQKTYEQLFAEADKALYYIKNRGKNNFEMFDESDKYEEIADDLWDLPDYHYLPYQNCSEEEGTHNLLLFSLELLEKTKEVRNAIHIILDRVGRYFSLDAIVLLVRTDKGSTHKEFQWIRRDCKKTFDALPAYHSFEHAEKILGMYDELGMAEFSKEDISIPGVYEPEAESFLTARGQLDEMTIGELVFLDANNKRVWSVEEKSVAKGLSTILYSYISKKNAWETTKRVERLMRYDSVTGLPNYGTFKEMAEELATTNTKENFAIAYSGFSNFQYVNDSFGYAIGDAVLTRFGKFLQEEYSFTRCCGRITGDQFLVLLSYDNLEDARNEYIACCKHFGKTMELELGILNLTIFTGMAPFEKGGSHPIAGTIDNANLARKTVRGNAETDCLLFSSDLKKYLDDKLKIISTMASALEKEEFQVYLQPKTDLRTGEVIGAEALVRWIKKNGEMVYPDEFIPIFEENGFVTKIDFYVYQKVLVFLKERVENNLPIVPISVNFSRRHQDNPEFVNDILALLEEYNLPKQYIEVEITESMFMGNIDTLNENVKRLKSKGISISIDDFGSGYSSLNVLASVPADVIKIDKVFLEKDTPNDRTILKYLIAMMKNIGFKVVVEGVETKEQMLLLKETECDVIQGYVVAKPMPMNDFTKYL